MFVIVALFGAFAIVYHLVKYRLNLQISSFTITLFIAGFIVLLGVNIYFASRVDWAGLQDYFLQADRQMGR